MQKTGRLRNIRYDIGVRIWNIVLINSDTYQAKAQEKGRM